MASSKAFNNQPIQKRVKDAWAFLEKYRTDPNQAEVWAQLSEQMGPSELGILEDFKDSTKLLVTPEQYKFLTNVTDKIDELKKALGVR